MAAHNIQKNVAEHQGSKAQEPIKIKASKEGSLHTAMGVKQGNKISTGAEQSKLAAAKRSGNTSLEKKLVFAINAKKFNH